jgi:predicted XRE-type DNA-binding protein
MSNETFNSVWDAIEDTVAEAENMKARSTLMMFLEAHIKAQGWTQAEAARQLGVTQPRVSDLMRGKIQLFGLDTLVNMVSATGRHVEVRVTDDNGKVAA